MIPGPMIMGGDGNTRPTQPASAPRRGAPAEETGSFSAQVWAESAPIRSAIDELPFVRSLADGTLERAVFDHYLAQDAHYLRDYARALATLAALAPTRETAMFWARASAEGVETEMLLHTSYLGEAASSGAGLPPPSPTCTLYTSFLLAEGLRGGYASLAAAVLPCFVVYEDVGRRLADRVRDEVRSGSGSAHPYGTWIATYEDDALSARRASALVDEAAARATEDERRRMREAYLTSTRCEWMFWDAAWRKESWPV